MEVAVVGSPPRLVLAPLPPSTLAVSPDSGDVLRRGCPSTACGATRCCLATHSHTYKHVRAT